MTPRELATLVMQTPELRAAVYGLDWARLADVTRQFNRDMRALRYRDRIVTRAAQHRGQRRRGSNGWA